MESAAFFNVGVVFIGRNEGERLIACAQSLAKSANYRVYVDSGSTDDSIQHMREMGVHVVSLDLSQPFTAARARNAGFEKLIELAPQIEFVQFFDGDCILQPDWMKSALDFLHNHSEVAGVCGRRHEMYPDQSIYNTLCDIEWNTPVGEALACGGDALFRASVFSEAGGFNGSFIAGEEPELCFRIRSKGYRIWRLDEEMTTHDANITHFSQWWKRTQRAGYAFALGAFTHGRSDERFWVRESCRAIVWGGAVPASIGITSLVWQPAMFFLLVYLLQWIRIVYPPSQKEHLVDVRIRATWGWYLILGKFAEFSGVIKFAYDRFFGLKSTIIEYK